MKNIAELLKNTPCGFKLYSPLYGEIMFDRLDKGYLCGDYIYCKQGRQEIVFDCYGRFVLLVNDNKTSPECLLFPSAEQREWSDFEFNVYKRERNFGCEYVYLGESFETHTKFDYNEEIDNENFEKGNYFPICLKPILSKLGITYYNIKEKQQTPN